MKANKKLKCYQIMKINPKAFAISFLIALGQADLIAITKWMANALALFYNT